MRSSAVDINEAARSDMKQLVARNRACVCVCVLFEFVVPSPEFAWRRFRLPFQSFASPVPGEELSRHLSVKEGRE